MTNAQRIEIEQLRRQGKGYGSIAKKLGLSSNTVASFCRRNNLTSANFINGTAINQDEGSSNIKKNPEIRSGNTVFIISRECKEGASGTLKEKLESLIVEAAQKEFRSCHFVRK